MCYLYQSSWDCMSCFDVATIPQPKLASDLGSLKITKCRWTVRRYKLVTNGWSQYLIFSSDGRTVLLFLYTVNRSVGISFCLGQ